MAISIDNHHKLCDGGDCATWDCAELPVNVAPYREGEVTAVNEDGSVTVRWSDGTEGVLPKRKPPAGLDPWIESVRVNGKCKDAMCVCQKLEV